LGAAGHGANYLQPDLHPARRRTLPRLGLLSCLCPGQSRSSDHRQRRRSPATCATFSTP
jgi:hypothetical protein